MMMGVLGSDGSLKRGLGSTKTSTSSPSSNCKPKYAEAAPAYGWSSCVYCTRPRVRWTSGPTSAWEEAMEYIRGVRGRKKSTHA